MGPRTFTKELRVTLVCATQETRSTLVTLTRSISGTTSRWSASASVEQVGHTTAGHLAERDALAEIAEWLCKTFGARTTCLGSTVILVGASPASGAA